MAGGGAIHGSRSHARAFNPPQRLAWGAMGDQADAGESTTSSWVRAAKGGDAQSFALLHEHLAPSLLAWAELRIRPEQRALLDAQDLVQEVWFRAWRGIENFATDRGPTASAPSTWYAARASGSSTKTERRISTACPGLEWRHSDTPIPISCGRFPTRRQ